jgi:hypothetical protein
MWHTPDVFLYPGDDPEFERQRMALTLLECQ